MGKNSGLLKIAATFFQKLQGYSGAMPDIVFIKKT